MKKFVIFLFICCPSVIKTVGHIEGRRWEVITYTEQAKVSLPLRQGFLYGLLVLMNQEQQTNTIVIGWERFDYAANIVKTFTDLGQIVQKMIGEKIDIAPLFLSYVPATNDHQNDPQTEASEELQTMTEVGILTKELIAQTRMSLAKHALFGLEGTYEAPSICFHNQQTNIIIGVGPFKPSFEIEGPYKLLSRA